MERHQGWLYTNGTDQPTQEPGMRTIDVQISNGGQDMDDTEVFDWEVPQTAEIPVVRPDFADLLTQGRVTAARRRPSKHHVGGQQHAVPLPLLPAPRAVLDPMDQLTAPRSGRTRWTKDDIEQALWKTVILGLVVLSGLMVWNSDTGKSIREELSTPSVTLSPQHADTPVVARNPASRVKRSQTQSAETRKTLSRLVAAPTTQSEAPRKGSDPVLPITADTTEAAPTQSAKPTPTESHSTEPADPPANGGENAPPADDEEVDSPVPDEGGQIDEPRPPSDPAETPPPPA